MATPITAKTPIATFLVRVMVIILGVATMAGRRRSVPCSVPYRVARPAGRVKRRPENVYGFFRPGTRQGLAVTGAAARPAPPRLLRRLIRQTARAGRRMERGVTKDRTTRPGWTRSARNGWQNYLEARCGIQPDFRGSGVRAADFQPPGPGRVAMAARAQCRRTAAADAGRPAHRRAPDRRHGGPARRAVALVRPFSFAADAAAVYLASFILLAFLKSPRPPSFWNTTPAPTACSSNT